jgi:hypothetical protein
MGTVVLYRMTILWSWLAIFEIFEALLLKDVVFCDMRLYGLVHNFGCFGEILVYPEGAVRYFL